MTDTPNIMTAEEKLPPARGDGKRSRVYPWYIYAVCACGWRAFAPFGGLSHLHIEVCPECGAYKESFKLENARYVSMSIWYKPNTWGTGYWETYNG